MKSIVIIPTYNEKENIEGLIREIRTRSKHLSLDVLIVDSASPDGTAEKVKQVQVNDPDLYLIEQKAKLGLGKAYWEGIEWAFKRNYECLITMDADFSHDPKYLPDLIERTKEYDVVVGSRYIRGGKLKDWPLMRRCLSRFANWYAKTLTGLPFFDLTSGFQCYRVAFLRKIMAYPIHAEGYAFLIELKYLATVLGAKIGEIPIVFTDRKNGNSKISKKVILESIFFVFRLALQPKPKKISY
ncbi:MAG: hypothetical protein A3G33_03225 [Omnitrophica bacterium RIFCSPLOWO2_12_FULL_44_17]|uniref:Glycosyltransferase 2-like domain-containing protein n=1 Tax=Candidatus Danuiimicrobium aquiferis TaxID=1801832 RepID=A0A1G1KTT3_9BACT|nr:MAG: hypothetical protein A3B72_06770 [Omnitrophica bacterium RIFCSPHIGHO2_02_FULL_45_28]OGW88532.1 MAG: hypothetical protein A3E74_02020 [Omnitrophica bacterium RIFCSPHIGHO2_12_FULL_44_12]OGW96331.1 MAG: hypothetical protein A3G33_03225 [Omnitrophica bacterium RIFCSPLOWO2_12_FULL_44_17]OGX04237.1 MAG: hypothetical protein A3J12_10810 [Omnitrophica bacterium RIFCSPLOWO2_02_FULL_44_11]